MRIFKMDSLSNFQSYSTIAFVSDWDLKAKKKILRKQIDGQTGLENIVLEQEPAELEAQLPFLSLFTKGELRQTEHLTA